MNLTEPPSNERVDPLVFPAQETVRSATGRVSDSLRRLWQALRFEWQHRGIPQRGRGAVRTQRVGTTRGGSRIAPTRVRRNGIAYCAGLSDDLSFELELVQRFDLAVYVFDPTPGSQERVGRVGALAGFYYVPVGLWGTSGSTTLYPTVDATRYPRARESGVSRRGSRVDVRTIPAMMKQLGHEGRPIDVLKLDIEGAEYDVIDNMIASGVRPSQIVVSFHHRYEAAGLSRTRDAVRMLRGQDYHVAAVDGAVMTFVSAAAPDQALPSERVVGARTAAERALGSGTARRQRSGDG
ncbi:MAG: FkbM family methyltransferase [Gemmatimonadetes bacterium]|nr:FkbM family methyltransferase [Gemmatimonadota bacterium]